MNKKKTLLLLTTIATSLAVGTIALMPHEEKASFLAENSAKRGVTNSLTMSSNNFSLINNRYYRVYTSNSNFVKVFCSGQYGSIPQNSFLRFVGTDTLNVVKEEGNYHAITGIESITVNYVRCPDYISAPKVTEAGQAGDLSIQCGYVDSSGNLLYESARSVSPSEALDLSDVSPRYFKITKAWNTSNVNCAIYIQSITINYTCSESIDDRSILDAKFNSMFEVLPSKSGVTWTYGYYPQSKVDPDSEVGYRLYSLYDESWTALTNGYYYVNGKVYARVQAHNTGYDNEYVIGEYYWFEVEPVTWKQVRVMTTGQSTLKYGHIVISEKVLDTSMMDTYESGTTAYSASTLLGQKMSELFTSMLPSNRSTYAPGGNLQNDIESGNPTPIFPLRSVNLSSNSTSFADGTLAKYANATDYARSQSYSLSDALTSDNRMTYWTRSASSGQFITVSQSGVTVNADRWQTYGVRPVAKIKWATAS